MPAPHVEERLEERVVPAVADCAFELLRSPQKLARFIEEEGKNNTAVAVAERVALPLSTDGNPAHLMVTKDGHGITCLGSGMAFDVPAIAPDRVQAYLRAQAEHLRIRVADGRFRADRSENQATLNRMVREPWSLDWQGFERVRMLSPLLTDFFVDTVKGAIKRNRGVAKASKRHPMSDGAAREVWTTTVRACIGLMTTGHERAMMKWCLVAANDGDVLLATRGLWMSTNQPERTLEYAESHIQSLARSTVKVGAQHRRSPLWLAPVLEAVCVRFPHHAKDARDLYLRAARMHSRMVDDLESRVKLWDRCLAKGDPGLYLCALLAAPLLLKRMLSADLFKRLHPPPEDAGRVVTRMYRQGERDITKLAAPFDPLLGEIMKLLQPMRHHHVPVPLRPVNPAGMSQEERTRSNLWRNMLNTNVLPPGFGNLLMGALVTLSPMEALIPGEHPDALMHPEPGMLYVRNALPDILTHGEGLTPIKHQRPQVGRNEPCPCGSGKKYKKCCDGKPPA